MRMADDMWQRIGRVAKDKVSGAKGWVDKGANLDADINVRGATSGAVIGVIHRLYISIIFLTAALLKHTFSLILVQCNFFRV